MKPILVEEDSTDDEYDENMNLKKIKSKNKGIGNGGNFLDEDEDQENDSEFDENNQPLPQKRVGREILRLGRVNYRVPEILPDWIMQRKEQISEHRTTKQLRRCIKNWMLKPDREIQKKYAEKEIGWSNTAPREAVKEASRVMSYGPEETVAYVNFFMPSRYVITRRVFNELKELLPKYRPRRIYDFGCGPATCAAAAIDVWGQDTVERYVGVDMSQSMLDAAKIMTTRMGLVIPNSSSTSSSSKKGNGSHDKSGPDIIFTTKSADVIGRIAASKDDSQRFDMAIAAYTLSELTSDSVKRAAVQVLFESLDNNGLLVIIDNGSPIGSHHTRSARQMLLDLFGNKDNL
jgi:ribosomal protein RSM22 (predicted rRNA methylase)